MGANYNVNGRNTSVTLKGVDLVQKYHYSSIIETPIEVITETRSS
jgi:hypothetical protein